MELDMEADSPGTTPRSSSTECTTQTSYFTCANLSSSHCQVKLGVGPNLKTIKRSQPHEDHSS